MQYHLKGTQARVLEVYDDTGLGKGSASRKFHQAREEERFVP